LIFHLTGTIEDPEATLPYKEEEGRIFRELRTEGVVKAGFRRADRPGVYLIVEADALETAKKMIGRLPYVDRGLLSFEYVQVSEL
jgi:hypothetical protein